jgi:hypothetical protein
MAITFALSQALNKEKAEKAKNILAESVKDKQFEFIMLERGRGLGFDAAIISLHEDYASYLKVLDWLREFDFLDVKKTDSFLINLEDKVRYRPLTFSKLARYILPKAQNQNTEGMSCKDFWIPDARSVRKHKLPERKLLKEHRRRK